MYIGNPLKKLAPRSDKMIEVKKQYLKDIKDNPSEHEWKY